MSGPDWVDSVPGAEGDPAEEAGPTDSPSEARAPSDDRSGFWAPLREPYVWGLLALRGYLALVFLQAAVGHLGVAPAVLASQWTPRGAFAPLGTAVSNDPATFVHLVIGLEIALGVSVVLGLLTRLAGFAGLVLNAFFFAAFEWADVGQLYLSWDASLAALWLVVLLTGPGRYLGLGQLLLRRFPRIGPWLV